MRRKSVSVFLALAAALVLAPGPRAQTSDPTPEELRERERIRPTVEAALADLRDPADPSEALVDQHQRIVSVLAGLGPAVVPFLAAEVDLPDRFTFAPSVWALGLVEDPSAEPAIRKALDVADAEGGGFGKYRKTWCVYALALRGEVAALAQAASGATPVDWVEFMEDMRLADVAAGLTAPDSRSFLAGRIRSLRDMAAAEPPGEDGPGDRLVHAVRALGWVGDGDSVPLLVSLLSHPDPRIALEAVSGLGRIGGPAAIDGIVTALGSADADVRVVAARAVFLLRPSHRAKEIAARLEAEEDSGVRYWLYQDVAALLEPEAALEVLRSHRGRPDPLDRAALANAVGETGSRSGLNLLRVLLRDPSTDVALAAVRSIHRIGGEGAADTLLALLEDPRPAVAQTAVELLAGDGERRAAPRIAQVVLKMTSRPLTDPSVRSQVQIRAEALVDLRYTAPAADLRRHASLQPDPADRQILEFAASRLERIASLGQETERWVELSRSSVPWERALAYGRLEELGGKAAVAALLEALERSPGDEEVTLLTILGHGRMEAASDAFAKRLSDPSWDAPARRDARSAAAWGARRLGTPAMIEALERSALRRDGRDVATVAYLGVLAPDRAIPVIRRVLPLRLRYYDWPVGGEQRELVELLRALEAGASAAPWDRSPDGFHRH